MFIVVIDVSIRRLLKQQIHSKETTLQQVEHQEKRAVLQRRIDKWRNMQDLCMPAVSELRLGDSDVSPAEAIPLYLPSAIPPNLGLLDTLKDKERRLRLAQIQDTLLELRRLLRITLGLWDYKFQQVGYGQRANTRTRSLLARFQEKVNRCAERYRATRAALLVLDVNGSWLDQFLELRPEHVKAPRRGDDDESEGRRELSWIWMAQIGSGEKSTNSKGELDDSERLSHLLCTLLMTAWLGLRSEWAKCHARAARWSEEVRLLVEEMRRVLWFAQWKVNWWGCQATLRQD